MIGIAAIFLVLALLCFLLAAFNVNSPVNLTAAGLAFLALGALVPMFGG